MIGSVGSSTNTRSQRDADDFVGTHTPAVRLLRGQHRQGPVGEQLVVAVDGEQLAGTSGLTGTPAQTHHPDCDVVVGRRPGATR